MDGGFNISAVVYCVYESGGGWSLRALGGLCLCSVRFSCSLETGMLHSAPLVAAAVVLSVTFVEAMSEQGRGKEGERESLREKPFISMVQQH